MLRWFRLTANGTVVLGKKHNISEVLLVVHGNFGGSGLITFGYLDRAGVHKPLADQDTLAVAGERAITLGENMELTVNLAGASSPDIEIGLCAEHFTFSAAALP